MIKNSCRFLIKNDTSKQKKGGITKKNIFAIAMKIGRNERISSAKVSGLVPAIFFKELSEEVLVFT